MIDKHKELESLRKRWSEASQKNDNIMMNLWKRVGLKLKEEIEREENNPYNFAKKLFNSEN